MRGGNRDAVDVNELTAGNYCVCSSSIGDRSQMDCAGDRGQLMTRGDKSHTV